MEIKEASPSRENCDVKTVAETTSFHQVKSNGPYKIQTRRLSCFCSGCTEDKPDSCVAQEYVDRFVCRNLVLL